MSERGKESLIRSEADIFLPNNHSETRVMWKRAEPHKVGGVLEVLFSHYGAHTVSGIKQSAQLEQRSNNFFVSADEAKRVLKKNIAVTDTETLALTERLLAYLKSEGIPVQKIIPSTGGESPVAAHDHLWQLFAFIEGNHYGGTKGQLMDVASWIGRLHGALERVPFANEIAAKPRIMPQWTEEEMASIFANTKNNETPADRLIAENETFLKEQLSVVARKKSQLQNIPPIVGKGLMHPHDFFFEGDKMVAVIDFEEAHMYERPREVGNALHRLVRRYVEGESPRPWQETLKEGVGLFLDGYRQNHSLFSEDIALIPAFLRDELMNKVQAAYVNPRYAERQETRVSEIRKFIALLKEASYIQDAVTEYQKGK